MSKTVPPRNHHDFHGLDEAVDKYTLGCKLIYAHIVDERFLNYIIMVGDNKSNIIVRSVFLKLNLYDIPKKFLNCFQNLIQLSRVKLLLLFI